jgi:hypothetical protein
MVRGNERIVFDGALLKIEPDETVTLYSGDHMLATKGKLRVNDELYEDMLNHHMFAWMDERFLQMNPRRHRKAILLYTYYSAQLAMGLNQRRDKRVIARRLSTILREAGIGIGKNRTRDLEILKAEHDYLRQEGLIEGWEVKQPSPIWGEELWQIIFWETHPALARTGRESLSTSYGAICL